MVGVQSLNVVSEILQHLHGTTSREWNLEEGFSGKRKVWYKFYDRMIRNDKHYSKALNYIHYNPVKHQYVRDPFNWPWTSLYLYFEDKGREWLREQWRPYPPDDRTAGEFQE